MPNVDQMLTVLAPLKGSVTAIAVTTTATSYDLQQSVTPALGPNSGRANKRFYGSRFVRLHADGGAVYYLLADVAAASLTIDNTATGTAPANAHCAKIESGAYVDIWIPEDIRYLHHKTASGTATLRIYPASPRIGDVRG